VSTLGQKPATQHVSTEKQSITGNGGTSYTLQQSVSQASDIEVFVNNTRQEPAVAYNASGTTLTMTGAVNSSDSFYVIFQGKAIQTAGLPVDAAITASTMSLSETLSVTGATTLTGGVSGNPAFSGNVTVGGTLVNTGLITASAGVAIGGTGSANTLDDYEEGSWTPSLGGNTVYNSQVGKYTKVGNMVTIVCNVYVNTQGTGSVSQISGLPFAVSNITEYNANGDSHVAHCAGLAQNVSSITPAPMKNATTIRFFYIAAGGGNTNAANSNVFQNGTDMYFTCTYRTG